MRLKNEYQKAIAIPSTDGTYFFNAEEIVRCTADINYTLFHFINGKKFISSRNLGTYFDKLRKFGFVRIHKSHVINPNHVKKIANETVEMIDESVLPVARRRRKEVRFSLF